VNVRAVRLPGLPPLQVDAGSLVTILLVAVLVWPSFADRGTLTGALLALCVALGLILSVALHEVGHALVARAGGAQVEHIALTLFGGHTSYRGGRDGGAFSLLVSLAGPAVNLLLGGLAMLGVRALIGGEYVTGTLADLAQVLDLLASMNVALGVFNLLPGLPMDGGRALEAVLGLILPRRQLLATTWIGRVIAVLVVAAALASLLRGASSFSLIVLLWAVILAGMLWRGAGEALGRARTEARALELDLADLMRPVTLIRGDLPLAALGSLGARAADGTQVAPDPADLLVADPQRGVGRLDADAVAAVPASARAGTPVGAVTAWMGRPGRLTTGMHGQDLVDALLADNRSLYLVMDEAGQVVGCVHATDVNSRLSSPRP
jgi:Zn-dependent protease